MWCCRWRSSSAGLQLVFITTHLPNYLSICGLDASLGATALAIIGLFNVIGSYAFGWLGGRYPRSSSCSAASIRALADHRRLLRAAGLAAVDHGVLQLSCGTLLLRRGAAGQRPGVSQLFGLRYMATLTGIAFLSHQAGSFLGAWGGGMIYDRLGRP